MIQLVGSEMPVERTTWKQRHLVRYKTIRVWVYYGDRVLFLKFVRTIVTVCGANIAAIVNNAGIR